MTDNGYQDEPDVDSNRTNVPMSMSQPEDAAPAAETPASRRASVFVLLVLTLLVGLHAWQAFRCFPDWRSITDRRPILQVDHALHLYHGSLGSQFLWNHGTNWGYDPFFMAGYPKTPFHDPSAGLSDLCQFLAGGGYHPAAYKIGLLVTVVLFPVLLAAACQRLGLDPAGATAAVFFAVWYYWTGFSKTMLDTGLYSFLFSSVWLGLTCGVAVAWHRRPGWLNWLLLVATTGFAVFTHPTVSLMLAAPMGIFYLAVLREHPVRWHLGLWSAVAVVVAMNWFWLRPFWDLWPLRKPGYVFMATAPDDWLYVLDFYRSSPLALLIAAGGLLTLGGWIKQRRWDLVASVGTLLAVLFLLTFFGSCWSAARNLEPLRFQVPLHLVACIPAGASASALLRCGLRGTWKARLGAIVLTVSATAFLWHQGEHLRGYYAFRHPRQLAIGMHPAMVQLCQWIKQNTDPSQRILFEDQLRLLEGTIPESLHWSCLLPIYTDYRQYVGGQYQQAPLHHHAASFGDFHLAGRAIEEYSDQEIEDYLQRYNIGTVFCWSERSRRVFDRLPFLKQVARLDRFTIRPSENAYFVYRYDKPTSCFAKGTGTVAKVELNRIVLEDVTPADGQVVMRFHWLETMTTHPPLPLKRIPIAGDRVGFIGIELQSPLDRIEIFNSYRPARHRLMDEPD